MDLYHPVLDRNLTDVHPKTAAVLKRESGWVDATDPSKSKAPEEGEADTDTTSEEE